MWLFTYAPVSAFLSFCYSFFTLMNVSSSKAFPHIVPGTTLLCFVSWHKELCLQTYASPARPSQLTSHFFFFFFWTCIVIFKFYFALSLQTNYLARFCQVSSYISFAPHAYLFCITSPLYFNSYNPYIFHCPPVPVVFLSFLPLYLNIFYSHLLTYPLYPTNLI